MKKRLVLASVLAASSTISYAQIDNGSFESWSGNSPNGWTTIDSGISLSSASSPVSNGSASARITVNTSTQGSTDLRQSVSVSAGQTYQFSADIYHTDGGVRARLYVDGYQNYSTPSTTNQWQTISYSYTASSTGTIEVGLRFYDVSGFDGSEVVYVDNFLPASYSAPTPTPTPAPPTGCSNTGATLALITDNYASETSWDLKNSSSQVIYSGSGYSNNSTNTEDFCLADGTYQFTIYDSYGDGICCGHGNGAYNIKEGSSTLASGGSFGSQETKSFTIGGGSSGGGGLDPYYQSAQGLTGYALKTELHNIIKGHNSRGYSAIWGFYNSHEKDKYYENDNTILDIYSERPGLNDPYNYTAGSDQCGSYSGEGSCYNREHSFPKSWFGGQVEPMNSDIHHIFASDGYVNAKRSNHPYGEVGSASYTSDNGSKVGSARSGLGYTGTVFEPIDEFKGDVARAHFYMATRYQDKVANWENNSSSSNAALNGTSGQAFESWLVNMLKQWHQLDPVSQKEIDRNNAAYNHQGNRNPFVDHPEFVEQIW